MVPLWGPTVLLQLFPYFRPFCIIVSKKNYKKKVKPKKVSVWRATLLKSPLRQKNKIRWFRFSNYIIENQKKLDFEISLVQNAWILGKSNWPKFITFPVCHVLLFSRDHIFNTKFFNTFLTQISQKNQIFKKHFVLKKFVLTNLLAKHFVLKNLQELPIFAKVVDNIFIFFRLKVVIE